MAMMPIAISSELGDSTATRGRCSPVICWMAAASALACDSSCLNVSVRWPSWMAIDSGHDRAALTSRSTGNMAFV